MCTHQQSKVPRYQSIPQSGFSLIETLVAITILLVVIVGPLSITSSTARSTSFASDQVTAFFLAQEGVELAQKARDDFLLRRFLPTNDSQYLSDPWAEFTRTNSASNPIRTCFESFNSGGCGLEISDTANGTLVQPRDCDSSLLECRLYYNEEANIKRSRYTYTAGGATITPFTRRIRFQTISPTEIKVISEVTWRSGLTSEVQTVVVENHLFDIYAN